MKTSIPALVCLLLAIRCQAATITVDDNGPADYNNIQAAISAAVAGDTVTVADGLYTGPDNYQLDFKAKAITVQSQNGPMNCIIDCQNQGRGFYFHNGETSASVVDGFTITNGSQSQGAGVYCYNNCSPTITNCIIRGNSASSYGGGIYCDYYASPKISDCIIQDNSSNYSGGGVYCGYYSSATITNCAIRGNSASSYGGGIYCTSCTASITNCTIAGNSSGYSAGGIYFSDSTLTLDSCEIADNSTESRAGGVYCYRSSATITNCTFTGNSVNSRGGAMYCYRSAPIITNCTFNGNSATYQGGGLYCAYEGSPVITNCAFTNCTNHAIYEESSISQPTVECCLFNSNIDGDYFDGQTYRTYAGANGINSLAGAAHNLDGEPEYAFGDDTHLMRGSACIDWGTNDPPGGLPPTDKDGNPRPLFSGKRRFAYSDIGAYEYNTQQPSIALSASSLEFIREQEGANPENQSLQIRSCGGGVLNWQISEDCTWLSVEPGLGDSTGEIDSVVVSVDTDRLWRGVYTAALTVTDPNAVNSPRSVWVTLRIKGRLYVPEEYPTIQKAIDAAMDGETIEVESGTYNEYYLNVDKKLELQGINMPVIDTNGIGADVILLNADGCIVDGFEITAGYRGISVNSSNNTIRNNVVSTNMAGIEVYYGTGNNTLNNNQILDNTSRGLYLYNSGNNFLRQNSIAGSPVNFEVTGTSEYHYSQDIDISNTVDGKPIYYLVSKGDVLIDSSTDAGCVCAVSCKDIVIQDLVLNNNAVGVLLAYTINSRIENVTAVDNSQAGILLQNSTNNILSENNVSNNNIGIRLTSSTNTTLRDNICADNLYNFVCEGGLATDYQQDIDTSNTVNGKPIYFLVGKYNVTVDAASNAGCVFAVNCSNIVVRDIAVSGNGTGVAFVSTSNSSIENVTATDNSNAGILLLGSMNSILRGSSVSGNARGVDLSASNYAFLENDYIFENRLGISCTASSFNVVNSIIKSNSDEGGFALYNESNGSLSNCTIYGNSRSTYLYPYGGGISCDYMSRVTVSNSIAWANRPEQIADESGGTSVTVTYCNVQGQFQGFGNISEPPMLTQDGHLCAGSPCINKGDPYVVYTKYDMDGEPRVYAGTVDIGADEFIDTDADGLPNWWENIYFDPNGVAGMAEDDADGDGHINLHEYQWYSSDPTVPCAIHYVDAAQPSDSNDGQSWETAKKTVQAAIAAAEASDRVIIAPGLYPEQLSTMGRALVIQSTEPTDQAVVASTVIAGPVSITRGELRGCNIYGVTISSRSGTGILCEGTSPTISNCRITSNWNNNWQQGGGITCLSASPTITNCIISGNVTSERGGALYCESSSPTISNCVISGNTPRYGGTQGSAMYLAGSDVTIDRCTLAENEYPDVYYSTYGTAIYCEMSSLRISNSILWNNVGSQIGGTNSSIAVSYSDIKGGQQGIQGYWEGQGNIDVDPCFVDSDRWSRPPNYSDALWIEGDHHLKSQGWRWIPYTAHGSNWVWDGVTSLCIDAGNPGTSCGDEAMTVPCDPDCEWGKNVRVNMGAYGGTAQASMAPHNWAMLGDLTNDGKVDFADLARWAESSPADGTDCPADLNRNGIVEIADLALLAQCWLEQTICFGAVVPVQPPAPPPVPPPVPGPQPPATR